LAWKEIADDLKLHDFTREFNEKLKGVSRMHSLDLLLSLKDNPNHHTLEEKEMLAYRKNERYKELIQSITPKDIMPGIADFLDDLRSKGIKTGIASASKNVFTVMDHLKLTHTVDVIVDPDKIANTKPDPDVFLEADRLLDVHPSHCVGVEDAAAGVQAIKAAGMFAVAIGSKEAFPEADLVLPNTSELTLERIEGSFQS